MFNFIVEIVKVNQNFSIKSQQVDARNDGVNTPELYLKFWHFDPNSQTYQQNCRVDCPHYEDILSLCFHAGTDDDDPMFITTGLDTKFKVWKLSKTGDDASMEAGKYFIFLAIIFFFH